MAWRVPAWYWTPPKSAILGQRDNASPTATTSWSISISKSFSTKSNHDSLMARVAARVSDKRVLKLIRAFLNAGVMEDGLVRPVDEGTPQGRPLSPILSNLVLDDLDKELARRGHRFCRYADDCNIYVRSRRAGERVMASVSRFLTNKLRPKVNEAKSAVARPEERKFLGFSISNGGSERRIAPKAHDKFKGQIRDMTRRTRGFGLQQLVKELKPYIVGWRGYFGFCQTPRSPHEPRSVDLIFSRTAMSASGRTEPSGSRPCENSATHYSKRCPIFAAYDRAERKKSAAAARRRMRHEPRA